MTMKQHIVVHKLVIHVANNKCFSEGMLLVGYMKFLSVKSDHCFVYLFFPLNLVRGHSVLTNWSFLPTGKFKN